MKRNKTKGFGSNSVKAKQMVKEVRQGDLTSYTKWRHQGELEATLEQIRNGNIFLCND